DSAFAEYDIATEESLALVSGHLDGQDVPGEPLGCVMNIWRRAGIRPGHSVAVIGAGFIGALLVQMAARAGARVIAVSRRPFSRRVARQMGAAHVIDASADHDAIVA